MIQHIANDTCERIEQNPEPNCNQENHAGVGMYVAKDKWVGGRAYGQKEERHGQMCAAGKNRRDEIEAERTKQVHMCEEVKLIEKR